MRYNTPIAGSVSSLSPKASPKSFSTYSVSSAESKSAPIKVRPSANDMKDTTTVRITNPKFRQHNVEATDNFSAPVAKLSQWLAEDPTKPKKEFLTVRKGNNIIAKSNTFEKQTMAFGKKKQMLQEVAEKTVVTDNRKQFEQGIKSKTVVKEKVVLSTEPKVAEVASVDPVIEADAVPVETEFKVEEEAKAETEVEEVSEALAVVTIADKPKKASFEPPMEVGIPSEGKELKFNDDKLADEEELVGVKFIDDEKVVVEAKVVVTEKVAKFEKKEPEIAVVDDTKTFNEAKAEFVKKCPKMNSVQMRKQKIEEEEREARRRANNPYGLMKSSWRRPHPSRGLPSDAWKRTFQGNLPPKKTLAELP